MPALIWILLGVSALVTAVGFLKPVWFVSVGYAFSVVAMVAVTLALTWRHLDVAAAAQLLLLLGWGLRLGLFLARRERVASYRNRPGAETAVWTTWWSRMAMWVGVFVLYLLMVLPAVLGPADGAHPGGVAAAVRWIGTAVTAIGLGLEATADAQKSAAKRRDAGRFVDTGLFAWVRCPNYLGEALVWLGNLVAGACFLTSWWRVAGAVIGAGLLVFIMLGATKNQESKQDVRYGSDPAYRSYRDRVPILVPWVPVYSFRRLPVPKM